MIVDFSKKGFFNPVSLSLTHKEKINNNYQYYL